MAFTNGFRVTLEDGAEWEATADQRDLAAYELQDFYGEGRTFTRIRFMAFSAGARAKLHNLSWPRFNAVCVNVEPIPDSTDESDPTNPDPSGDH